MTNVIIGITSNASTRRTKRNQLQLKKLINCISMDLAVLQEELMNFYHNVLFHQSCHAIFISLASLSFALTQCIG